MCDNCMGTKRRIRRAEELEQGTIFGMTDCECARQFAQTQPVKMVRSSTASAPAAPVASDSQQGRSTDELIAVCRKAGLNEIADRLQLLQAALAGK